MGRKTGSANCESIRRDPDSRFSIDRRTAMQQMALAGAISGLPRRGAWEACRPLPKQELLERDPEKYWAQIRSEQFFLGETRIFLNPGSLGVIPRPVMQAVVDSLTNAAEYAVDDVPRWGYERLNDERAEMGAFLGCHADELAFTHSCTEAMSIIANGLDLKPGDEILLTNQEHGSGYGCWELKSKRYGTTVRQVEIPVTPTEPEELAERLISAIRPETRVLSFSGITSPTGLILPVKQICQAARDKGVISVLDGAHMDGQIPVDLHELGCDYFAGSPHKWLFAPAGCGFLYGREDMLDRLWPCIVSLGWDQKADWRSARFMIVGTNNRSTIDGMLAGVRFLKGLGEQNVYQRMHQLASLALQEAQRRDYLEVITPSDSRFYQAMVTMQIKSDKVEPLWAAMKARNICVLQYQPLRLSFHIHTRASDIHSFFETCDQVFKG